MTQTALLTERSLFRLSGKDAFEFLHNLITCDVKELANGQVTFGALLSPQGKVLFDFHLMKEEDTYLFDVANDVRDALMKRLNFYKLRADVALSTVDDLKVYAQWGDGAMAGDGRRPEMGERHYIGRYETNSTEMDWNRHRLETGMPQSGSDFALGDVFAHDVLMDQFVGGGVDFSKGCYVGQEVVSRMKHRNSARNRFVKIHGSDKLPPIGTEIFNAERQVGTVGSSDGTQGLALVRIDKVGKALEAGDVLTAEKMPIDLSLPEFATFGWGVA